MLKTLWFTPHGGGITRGGVDYTKAIRKIWLFNNFVDAADEMSWFKYMAYFRHLPKVSVGSLAEAMDMSSKHTDCHVVFRAFSTFNYYELKGEEKFLLEKLEQIAHPRLLKFVRSNTRDKFIGINIRCGNDFAKPGSSTHGLVQTRVQWYAHALGEIRKRYGSLPAIVVSDGGVNQLSEILAEKDVRLLNSPAAISDLLVLARASVLLGCGNSSFSTWAAYLGGMDIFSSPETPFSAKCGLELGRNGNRIISEI